MNKFLLSFIISICTTAVFAQTRQPAMASVGPEAGLPTGQAAEVYSLVAGASFKIQLPVQKTQFSFMLSGGYSSFIAKNGFAGIINDAAYIPVTFGGRQYFGSSFFLEGDLGLSVNINDNYSGPKAAFIYAPVLGFSTRETAHNDAFDFAVKYEGRVETGGTISQVALRVAYRFKMK